MLTVREPLISNFQALQSAVDPGGVAGTGSTGETRLNRIARQTELRQRRAVVHRNVAWYVPSTARVVVRICRVGATRNGINLLMKFR